jgi:hypothetical protein
MGNWYGLASVTVGTGRKSGVYAFVPDESILGLYFG